MKKYGFYCSGNATRVIKFYTVNKFNQYPASFILYDGNNRDAVSQLCNVIPSDLLLTFGSQLEKYNKKEASMILSNKLLEVLLYFNVDYLYCFGDRILTGGLIKEFKNKIINFHPSLLPAFPGLNAIDQALKTSVQVIGNTAHFIDEGIDTGPIIMQSLISRASFKDYEDVLELQIKMLEKIWFLLNEDRIRVSQNIVEIYSKRNDNPYFSL